MRTGQRVSRRAEQNKPLEQLLLMPPALALCPQLHIPILGQTEAGKPCFHYSSLPTCPPPVHLPPSREAPRVQVDPCLTPSWRSEGR